MRRARIAFLSGFFKRGMGGNVGAVTALEYVMGGNLVERYGKKNIRKQPKIKLHVVIKFKCK